MENRSSRERRQIRHLAQVVMRKINFNDQQTRTYDMTQPKRAMFPSLNYNISKLNQSIYQKTTTARENIDDLIPPHNKISRNPQQPPPAHNTSVFETRMNSIGGVVSPQECAYDE